MHPKSFFLNKLLITAGLTTICLMVMSSSSCKGYGIRIEFITPDNHSEKPVEKAKVKPAKKDEKKIPSQSTTQKKQNPALNEANYQLAFQNWFSESNWLIIRLERGLESNVHVKKEIEDVRDLLLELKPFLKTNEKKTKVLEDFADRYSHLSDIYTNRRRIDTAELLSLLHRKIFHKFQNL